MTHFTQILKKNLTDAIDAAMPWTKIVHISENDRSTPGQGMLHGMKRSTLLRKQTGMAGW